MLFGLVVCCLLFVVGSSNVLRGKLKIFNSLAGTKFISLNAEEVSDI